MRGSIVHLIVLLCVASTTEAAIKQWVGGTGTSFATPDNWVAPPDTEDPTPPPGPGDFADFTAFGGLVTFPANVTNAQTLVTQTVEFQLLTNTYSTELTVAGSGDLTVRNGTIITNNPILASSGKLSLEADAMLSVLNQLLIKDGARLIVIGGTVDSVNVTVGMDTTVTARLVLNGGTLNSTNPLILGDGGRGAVSMSNGATLNVPSIVFGATTTGRGDLTIGNAASLTLLGTTVIGEQGSGSIEVDGGALTLQSVEIGKFGSGSLSIDESGTVIIQSGDVKLGLNPGVSGSISVRSGMLTLPGSLFVGLDGTGRLRTDGGTLTVNGDLHLGSSASSSGNWDLDTNETTVVSVTNNIIVGSRGIFLSGSGGSGEIHGEIGAETTISANAFIIGDGALGLVFFDEFEEGTLDFNSTTIGNIDNGVMNINGGSWDNSGAVIIGRGDILASGPVEGSVSLFNTAVSSSSLALGEMMDSSGELEMSGGSWQIAAGLVIGNGGTGSVSLSDGATMTSVLNVIIGNNIFGGGGSLSLHGAGTQLEVTTVAQGVKVGPSGAGSLSVTGGARLNASFLFVAEGLGSTSSVVASGAGTMLDIAGGIVLDKAGDGRLSIFDGAMVDSAIGVIDSNGLALGHNATVSGTGSVWTTIDLTIGMETTSGGLAVESGARVQCSDCAVGENIGAKGRVLLRDALTRLDVLGDFHIGGSSLGPGGEGEVEIQSGATGNVGDQTTVFALGRLDVTDGGLFFTNSLVNEGGYVGAVDPGSFIGVSGLFEIDSRLDVFAGARVDAGAIEVAADSLGPSEIKIDGNGSILNVLGDLSFSGNGDGTLAASNGAQVFSDTAILDNGVGTFSVNTSVLGMNTWWQTNNLIIGTDSLYGGVAIESGGRLTCIISCTLGAAAGARGVVTVTDANSIFDSSSGSITVAEFGTGALQASSGGEIYSVGGHVGKEPGGVGAVEIVGPASFWSSSADVHVGFEQIAAEPGEGVVRLFNGASIAAPTVAVHDTGQLFGAGTIFGNLTNGGLVGLGFEDFPATLTVTEDYTQLADGALSLQIGGTEQGTDFGYLDVGEDATLAGQLGVSFLGSYEPSLGDSFIILTATAVSGGFDTIFLPDLGPLDFFIVYGPDFVSLAVINPAAIPLPATFWLIVPALLMLTRFRRRVKSPFARSQNAVKFDLSSPE